jgi:hypothetical protein
LVTRPSIAHFHKAVNRIPQPLDAQQVHFSAERTGGPGGGWLKSKQASVDLHVVIEATAKAF